MTWYLDAALACAFYGLVAGLLVPAIIARVPEPEPEPGPEPGPSVLESDVPEDAAPATDPEPAKELYVDIAGRRGLRHRAALATGAVAGLMGGAVGWSPALYVLLFLAPVGVALAVIDWRTRLLPTKLIAPSYVGAVALVLLAAWVDGDVDSLVRAGWGWLAAGGSFFVLWFLYPRGMGYGDVRLSGVLGIALGYLGWAELVVGLYAGFLLGGIGGLVLSLLRLVERKAYPFGPFMLVGAVVGVVLGPGVAAWYS